MIGEIKREKANFEIFAEKKFKKDKKMQNYADMSSEQLSARYAELLKEYNGYKARELSLDLSRGKPNAVQLDASQRLMDVELRREDCFSEGGLDCRNYGCLDGLPEMKRLFSEYLGIDSKKIIVGGNSSLQLMYDTLARAMLFGTPDSERPWCMETGLKWICVVPGYDRHFKITEELGFELLSVKMKADGPDMDEVRRLVRDPKVKGIWCVPKYSNPTGNTYSDEVVRALVTMECGAKDFRIFWDNAYAVHDFGEDGDKLVDVFAEAEKYGNEDRVICFSSTSKITFPGAGVAMLAASDKNRRDIISHMSAQTIGYDKINQLRHIKYFGNKDGVRDHMLELGGLIRRKFDITLEKLSQLRGEGIAEWTEPNGGYFVSLDVMAGCAARVYELMREAGVVLTPVGATFPYGKDPENKNLRIAPTYPTDEELALALDILVVAVRMAAIEKLTSKI